MKVGQQRILLHLHYTYHCPIAISIRIKQTINDLHENNPITLVHITIYSRVPL